MPDNVPSAWRVFGWIVLAAIVIQTTIGAVVIGLFGLDRAGVFGDLFGVVNTLFSGLALAGIVVAILLQKSDLEAQREELRLTRREMVTQRQEMKAQTELLQLQAFETSFYSMLRSLREGAMALQYPHGGPRDVVGLEVFDMAVGHICRAVATTGSKSGFNPPADLEDELSTTYSEHCVGSLDFGPYCRSLTALLEFVASDAPRAELYASLVRAHLSTAELSIYFVYGGTPEGRKAKAVAERYGLFAYWATPMELGAFRRLYDLTAFDETGQAA